MSVDPVPLSPADLRLAREAAEAQTPDSVILGSLRARVRKAIPRGPVLDSMLAGLQMLHPTDQDDLDDFRDDGRRKLQAVLYAAALAYALNEQAERYDADNPEHANQAFVEVDGKQVASAQFLCRFILAIDPATLKEEAQREAERIANMSAGEQRGLALKILSHVGVPDEEVARVANVMGVQLQAVNGGAA